MKTYTDGDFLQLGGAKLSLKESNGDGGKISTTTVIVWRFLVTLKMVDVESNPIHEAWEDLGLAISWHKSGFRLVPTSPYPYKVIVTVHTQTLWGLFLSHWFKCCEVLSFTRTHA